MLIKIVIETPQGDCIVEINARIVLDYIQTLNEI